MQKSKKDNVLMLGTTIKNNNKGCEALAIGAIVKIIEKHDCDKITIISGNTPAKTEITSVNVKGKEVEIVTEYIDRYTFYGALFEAFLFKIIKKTNNNLIKIISSSDIVYDINHGDGFTDNYGFARLIRAYFETMLTIVLKKPLIFLPQTIGPFNTWLGKQIATIILKGCSKVYVRDCMANGFLTSIGVPSINTYDLSIYMLPEENEFHVEPNTIGINVSGLLHFKTDVRDVSSFKMYDVLIETLLRTLLENNYNILLIPHTYNIVNSDPADDFNACLYFVKKINSNKIKVVNKDYTAPQLKHIISKCCFFIGSRMHSNFAALSTSTPVIGLAYSYKFEGGFNEFGVKDNVISLNNIKSDDIPVIIEKILSMISKRNCIKEKLIHINRNIKELQL